MAAAVARILDKDRAHTSADVLEQAGRGMNFIAVGEIKFEKEVLYRERLADRVCFHTHTHTHTHTHYIICAAFAASSPSGSCFFAKTMSGQKE